MPLPVGLLAATGAGRCVAQPATSATVASATRTRPRRRTIVIVMEPLSGFDGVGQIADRAREIRGVVPLHDGAEIVVDEKGGAVGAARQHQRRLDLVSN